MKRYIDWVSRQALPFWAERGFDAAAGRFHERLDAAARPLPVPHRAMVQARQVYVFAEAAARGWFPAGGEMACMAMANLRRDFCVEDGTCAAVAFSIDPSTRGVVSSVRDAYAHAFVLFAAARVHALTGDPDLLAFAWRVVAAIDRELGDAQHGGLFDAAPAAPGAAKRQNPHMHLLEAYLAWEQAAPGQGFLARADALVTLFKHRFFSARHGVLLEHFHADWGPHPDAGRAGIFEPGHHYEWIWLLAEHERLTGASHADHARALATPGATPWMTAEGLIHDELSVDGHVVKASHRVWPHTEAVKAAVVAHRSGDPGAAAFAGRMADVLLRRFLDTPFAGGWTDHIDTEGRPLVDYVPASTLYHLMLAAVEAQNGFVTAPAAADAT